MRRLRQLSSSSRHELRLWNYDTHTDQIQTRRVRGGRLSAFAGSDSFPIQANSGRPDMGPMAHDGCRDCRARRRSEDGDCGCAFTSSFAVHRLGSTIRSPHLRLTCPMSIK